MKRTLPPPPAEPRPVERPAASDRALRLHVAPLTARAGATEGAAATAVAARHTPSSAAVTRGWVAVHEIGSPGPPALAWLEDGVFYWRGGSAHAHSVSTFCCGTYMIVRAYDEREFPYAAGDAVELRFHRDFPPARARRLERSAGWISPTGRFYPCGPWDHDKAARAIAAVAYGVLDGTARLEAVGWIRLDLQGWFNRIGSTHLTQAQIDTLFDLSCLDGDPAWTRRIRERLNALTMHGGSWAPCDVV